MLDKRTSPCAAFETACTVLRQTKNFAPDVQTTLDRLARATFLKTGVRYLKKHDYIHSSVERYHWLAVNNVRVHGLRIFSGPPLGNHSPIPAKYLRANLLGRIAYEIGLPHTATSFAYLKAKNWTLEIAPEPFPRSRDLYALTGKDRDSRFDNEASCITFCQFFKRYPALTPQFMAITVFDVFAHNDDRHHGNILAGKVHGSSIFNSLCGIDLDKSQPTKDVGLAQAAALPALMSAECIPLIQATLTALETYPENRLFADAQQLAQLASPDIWHPEQEAQALLHSRETLRKRLAAYVPKKFACQLS